MAPLEAGLGIAYKLTPGLATGRSLAELAERRIVGARCAVCDRTLVPASDTCPRCVGETELVEMPQTGVVTAFTARGDELIGLIRLDGASADLVHRLVETTLEQLEPGRRVEAVWADTPVQSILAISGFRPAEGGGEPTAPRKLETETEPVVEVEYRLDLAYRHAYGAYYGRLFDELKETRRIVGARCPSCHAVLVPPRAVCEVCFVRTEQFEDVADTGVLRAFSVIHLAFEGQVREPPYVYAEITLDGAATRLIHVVGGIDVEQAHETLRPGMRVRAAWNPDSHTGTLADIDHFEPVEG
jgi:uncharacterized OB-fold protein